MGKEVAFNRIFGRVFICRNCNAKIRASMLKVKAEKVRCRKCLSPDLRPKNKEKKA